MHIRHQVGKLRGMRACVCVREKVSEREKDRKINIYNMFGEIERERERGNR